MERDFFGGALSDTDRAKLAAIGNGGNNGGHRKAPQAPSGGSPDGASAGDKGTVDFTTGTAVAFDTIHTGAGASKGSALMAMGSYDPWKAVSWRDTLAQQAQAEALRQQQAAMDKWRYQMLKNAIYAVPPVFTKPAEPEKPLPSALVVGEIIAWRAWRVQNGLLTAMYVKSHIWPPHEAIQGDPNAVSHDGIRTGVHGWKSQKDALEYAARHTHDQAHSDPNSMFTRVVRGTPVIVGRVKLWGEVIEHETGYRAEYAKVHSLDVPLGIDDATLNRLRALYVKPPASLPAD